MDKQIGQERFAQEYFAALEETFETHHGVYLDEVDSLLNTLAGISAAQASIPVGGQCATLAAQVAHVTFFLEVLERHILKQPAGKVDWGEIWRTVGTVTEAEWGALKSGLDTVYRRVSTLLRGLDSWDDPAPLGGALAILVHTAYHLGEIRQALCTLR